MCISAVLNLVLWHNYLWANFPLDLAILQIKLVFQAMIHHQAANVCY